jgi:hypothetical protein
MKITQFNLQIFVEELKSLEEMIPDITGSAENWLKYQKQRDQYGWRDEYGTSAARAALEDRLTDIRQKLATVYDFMGDRGLTNFEPTTLEMSQNGRGTDAGGTEQDPHSDEGTPGPQERGTASLVQRLRQVNQSSDQGGTIQDNAAREGVQDRP